MSSSRIYTFRCGSCPDCRTLSTGLVRGCGCSAGIPRWHLEEKVEIKPFEFNQVTEQTRALIDDYDREIKSNASAQSPMMRPQIIDESFKRTSRRNSKYTEKALALTLQKDEEKTRKAHDALIKKKRAKLEKMPRKYIKKSQKQQQPPGPYGTIRLRNQERDSGSPPSSPTPIVKK